MLTNLMMVIILHLYRNSCLDFFLITKINFNRVKRIDSDLQDEKWDGNSGIPFSCEVCLSHVPIVRIITCVNPGEGTVLLIAPLQIHKEFYCLKHLNYSLVIN